MSQSTCLSGFPIYLGKTMGSYKFCHSWLTKADRIGRKINTLCQIGNDEFYFYCKICRNNLSCCKDFYALNQPALSTSTRKRLQSKSIYYNYGCVDLLGSSPNEKSQQLAVGVTLLRCFATKMVHRKQKSNGYSIPCKLLCLQLQVMESLMSSKPCSW